MKKKILLAITGSIAAIKAFDLIKSLQEKNFEVQCIMTKGGEKFCSTQALQAMTGFPVLGPKIFSYEKNTNPFEKNTEKIYAHLELSKISEAMIIAPCSANTLAKISSGQADDFLSTALLAYQNPVLIAPAMNTKMWESTVVQGNIEKMQSRGYPMGSPYSIIPPQKSGILACGEEGAGKMASVGDIVLYVKRAMHYASVKGEAYRAGGLNSTKSIHKNIIGTNPLNPPSQGEVIHKKNILINLGGTQEKIDPVRYIGNFSTGKTGKILAEKFFELGYTNISVVQGTSTVQLSEEIFDIQKISSAQEMYQAMKKNFFQADIVVFCAAVADFKVKKISEKKLKKNSVGATQWVAPTIGLQENIDIAKTFAKQKLPHQIFIGFTLETSEKEDLKKSMILKSKAKKFDIVFGNSPKNFGTTEGKFLVYWAEKKIFEEYTESKEKIFEEVLGKIL